MPRENRRNQRMANERRVPGWVWFFTGTVFGAFVMFLADLSKVRDPGSNGSSSLASEQRSSSATPSGTAANKDGVNSKTKKSNNQPVNQQPVFEFLYLVKGNRGYDSRTTSDTSPEPKCRPN